MPVDNEATVSWSGQHVDYSAPDLAAGSASFTLDDVQFTLDNATDNCVTVSDTLSSIVTGTICASQTFTYSNYVSDPGAGKCTTVNNTAQFTTTDTQTSNSSNQSVTFCHYRFTFTMGYWKNHAANSAKTGSFTSGDCSRIGSTTRFTYGSSIEIVL